VRRQTTPPVGQIRKERKYERRRKGRWKREGGVLG